MQAIRNGITFKKPRPLLPKQPPKQQHPDLVSALANSPAFMALRRQLDERDGNLGSTSGDDDKEWRN